jgi:hypothetical protein
VARSLGLIATVTTVRINRGGCNHFAQARVLRATDDTDDGGSATLPSAAGEASWFMRIWLID